MYIGKCMHADASARLVVWLKVVFFRVQSSRSGQVLDMFTIAPDLISLKTSVTYCKNWFRGQTGVTHRKVSVSAPLHLID